MQGQMFGTSTTRVATALLLACTVCTAAEPAPTTTPAKEDPKPVTEAKPTAPVAWSHVDAMVKDLPATLRGTGITDLEALGARIRAVPGVATVRVDEGRISIELTDELDASHVVELLGWTDAHVLSGDVHQRSWHVEVRTQDLADPYGRRIATERPSYGDWWLEVPTTARPEGDLPGISAGASPAYPLAKYAAKVKSLSIVRARA